MSPQDLARASDSALAKLQGPEPEAWAFSEAERLAVVEALSLRPAMTSLFATLDAEVAARQRRHVQWLRFHVCMSMILATAFVAMWANSGGWIVLLQGLFWAANAVALPALEWAERRRAEAAAQQ